MTTLVERIAKSVNVEIGEPFILLNLTRPIGLHRFVNNEKYPLEFFNHYKNDWTPCSYPTLVDLCGSYYTIKKIEGEGDKMKKTSYLEQVTHMLGVEPYEEFTIKDIDNKVCGLVNQGSKFRFTPDKHCCLEVYEYGHWTYRDLISKLITGNYQIVKLPYKPKKGQYYYSYVSEEIITRYEWTGNIGDLMYWKVGNCFRSEEEAKTKGKEVIENMKKEYQGGKYK